MAAANALKKTTDSRATIKSDPYSQKYIDETSMFLDLPCPIGRTEESARSAAVEYCFLDANG
jgi:hypothetical protein